MQRKVLRSHAYTYSKPCIFHNPEVRIIQLHARIRRAGFNNSGLHLGSDGRDGVRLAHIARTLRVLFTFDIPGNGSLRSKPLHVHHIRSRLPQYASLKLGQPGVICYVKLIRT